MAATKSDAKTQRINVFLTPEQVEWLKTKKNSSAEIRALITEAMNMENLVKSVKKGASKKASAKKSRK
jgi:phosphorylcholine metabolism protein LicD